MMLPPAQAMGVMTAMTTHELQNILAIIRESAGLMGDILEINAKVGLQHRAKLEEALEHITTQVDRAKRLLEAMNRLGHAPDTEYQASCDLGLQVRALVELCGRPSRLKGLSLHFTPASQPLPVQAPALQVFAEGFTVLRAAIDLCPAGSTIAITLEPGVHSHAMVLTLPAPPSASPVLTALSAAERLQITERTVRLPYPAYQP